MRLIPNLLLLAVALLTASCGHMYLKTESYAVGEEVEINGAKVRSPVRPNGGSSGFALSAMVYSAGSGSLDGPFLWRIEATGREGVHEALTVHRLKVTTEKTKRSEWFPGNYLGTEAPFQPVPRREGETFAQFQIPGELEVYPQKDGSISICAEISVRSTERTERRIARFRLEPESSRGLETLNVPAELVKSWGGPDPAEWKIPAGRGDLLGDAW